VLVKRLLHILLLLLSVFASHAQWVALGDKNALNDYKEILAICSDKAGNIYAAGTFTGQPLNMSYISKWNGQVWSRLGALNGHFLISEICADEDGNLYAVIESSTWTVSKWNGSNWVDLGIPSVGQGRQISNLHADKNGNLYVSGKYASGNPFVARWNSTSNWAILSVISGFTSNKYISSICTDTSGAVYTTGSFTNSAGNYYVAKWGINGWEEVGSLNGLAASNIIYTIHIDANGNLFAAGAFINSNANYFVAMWDGIKWSQKIELESLTQYFDDGIYSISSSVEGNLYIGGALFSETTGEPIVFKWNGSSLEKLSGGSASHDFFGTLCTDASGNLYSAGTKKGGLANNFVAIYPSAKFVGIGEQQINNTIKVFPNPCSNTLNFKNLPNTKTGVLLYDITGKVVLSTTLNVNGQVSEIDVSALSNGLYIAELRAEGKQPKRLKVVKD